MSVRFYNSPEAKILRKRRRIPVSEWAARHRYVTTGDGTGNRFKKSKFAYAPAVLDASFYKSVREIVLCWADQTGKSFINDTCIGYAADRDPGPVLFVYPDEDTAKDNMKDRLQPMFRMSPRLRTYMTGSIDDEGQKRINLQHMSIYAAWATSAVKLSNRPIKYGVADEVGKFPTTAGKTEGAPVDKIRKRFRHYRYDSKFWMTSTPTVENNTIWEELNTCDVVFEYRVRCPDCGDMHLMEFETVHRWFRWDDEKDPEKVEKDNLGYYVCPKCGTIWDDYQRDEAVRQGAWFAMSKTPDGKKEIEGAELEIFEHLHTCNPRKIGFHLPSWVSSAVSISSVCAAFLRGLKDKTKLKDFNNSHKAVPWTDYSQERQEDVILKLCDSRPRGAVPGGGQVCVLTAGVDTQGVDERTEWFRYEIRAWAWGDGGLVLPTSWQVREGRLESFTQLEDVILNTEYYDADGNRYMVRLMCQDAMGRRTAEVYNFCIRHRGRVIPTQGRDPRRMTTPFTPGNVEFYPGTKRPIPGGLKLYGFDNFHFKNILAAKLEINPGDPGAWYLHSETGEDWARELCAETIDPKEMRWVQIGSMPNHAWDCSVLNILAAEVLGVKYVRKPASAERMAQGAERREQGAESKEQSYTRPDWLRNRQT